MPTEALLVVAVVQLAVGFGLGYIACWLRHRPRPLRDLEPGDRDSGSYAYQHWKDGHINHG